MSCDPRGIQGDLASPSEPTQGQPEGRRAQSQGTSGGGGASFLRVPQDQGGARSEAWDQGEPQAAAKVPPELGPSIEEAGGPAPAQRGEEDPEGGGREAEPHPGPKAGTLPGPVYGLHGAKICKWNEEGVSHGDVGSRKWLGSWLDSG